MYDIFNVKTSQLKTNIINTMGRRGKKKTKAANKNEYKKLRDDLFQKYSLENEITKDEFYSLMNDIEDCEKEGVDVNKAC